MHAHRIFGLRPCKQHLATRFRGRREFGTVLILWLNHSQQECMGPYHPFRSYGACFYNQLGSKVWEIRTPTHTLYTKPDNSKDYRQYSVSVGGLPGHFNCTDKSECLRRLSQHLYCKLKTACCRSRNASQELGFDPVHCLQQGRGDTCLGIVQKFGLGKRRIVDYARLQYLKYT